MQVNQGVICGCVTQTTKKVKNKEAARTMLEKRSRILFPVIFHAKLNDNLHVKW